MATALDPILVNAEPGATKACARQSPMFKRAVIGGAILVAALWSSGTVNADAGAGGNAQLDSTLMSVLQQAGFSGRIESTLETRLGRPIDGKLANLGQMLFFDRLVGLYNDNTCAGCHAPASAFGDTQSIAIGVQNNLNQQGRSPGSAGVAVTV